MQSAPEQIPIPCARCGAVMVEEAQAAVLAAVTVRCSFCGVTEELPREPSERVVRLRARLAQIRWATQAEEGPTIALTRTLESWRQIALPGLLGMSGLVIVASLMSAAHAFDLPPAIRTTALLSALTAPLHVLALFGGVTLGFLWSMRAYIAEVRPTVEARSALAEGGPMRCRACGGDLPRGGHAGFVRCGYCTAENLVTEGVAKEREARLDLELRDRQARAAGVARRVQGGLETYKRRLYLAMGVSVGVSLTLTWVQFPICSGEA